MAMSRLFPKRHTESFPSLHASDMESDFFNKFFGEMNYPQVDIKEKDNQYEFMVDLPGYKKEDIEVEYKDGYLEIRGKQEHSSETEDKDGRYLRKERSFGTFKRSFFIGEIEQDQIKGAYHEGVLKLEVPKSSENKQEDQGHRIQIE